MKELNDLNNSLNEAIDLARKLNRKLDDVNEMFMQREKDKIDLEEQEAKDEENNW